MPSYTVRWDIEEIEASDPTEAARIALEIQRDPKSIATFFKVRLEGDDNANKWQNVDL